MTDLVGNPRVHNDIVDLGAYEFLGEGCFNETASATICEGEPYTFGTQTLTTAGEYTEAFQFQAGCDSTVVLTLDTCDEILSIPDGKLANGMSILPYPVYKSNIIRV